MFFFCVHRFTALTPHSNTQGRHKILMVCWIWSSRLCSLLSFEITRHVFRHKFEDVSEGPACNLLTACFLSAVFLAFHSAQQMETVGCSKSQWTSTRLQGIQSQKILFLLLFVYFQTSEVEASVFKYVHFMRCWSLKFAFEITKLSYIYYRTLWLLRDGHGILKLNMFWSQITVVVFYLWIELRVYMKKRASGVWY